jgi:predicted ArsR family transcriptional regulator
MCVVETDNSGTLRLVDYHVPLAEIMEKYTVISEVERDVIERLLGQPVERTMEVHSGLKRVIFRIH